MVCFLPFALWPPTTAVADTPPPMDGLVLWLDATDRTTLRLADDRVEAWRSKAPDVRARFAALGTRRPRHTAVEGRGPQAAVCFDGRDGLLLACAFGRRTATWTLVAVVAPLRPARGAILSAAPVDGNDYDPGFTVDLYESLSHFDYLSVEGAGRIGGRLNQRTRTTPFGVFSVVSVTRDETDVRLHVDGVLEGRRLVTPAVTVMDDLRVGARHYDGRDTEFLRGEIAELLLYDRALTDDERQAIEAGRIVSEAERHAGEAYGVQDSHERQEPRMAAPELVQSWPTVKAYLEARERGEVEAGPELPLDDLPLRTDLLTAIRLCMSCLNSSFDADLDGEPFFYSNCRVDGTGEFHHSLEIGIPHVTGRCLLGNMSASLAAGLPFPPDGLAILTRYLKSSFGNPDHLNSYVRPVTGGERGVEFHNMREGLYGLWALLHTDERAWAADTAAKMLRTLQGLTDERGRWSLPLLERAGMAGHCTGVSVPNAARLVDPLLAVYRETGDPVALQLAGQYSRAGLEELFIAEGRFTLMERSSGHVHSITSSLSGITEYALLTGDEAMVQACRRALDVGVPEYFSSWGWGDEVFPEHPADEVSRGEINQTGDVIRAALHLGAAGEPHYYELAERFVRSMLLPTQHREPELRRFMHDNENPTRDAERDVIRRSVGGYAMQLPNDRMAEGSWPVQTQDITSGAVHALAECWRHRVTTRDGVTSVNLLFDYQGEALSLTSELPLRGRLAFRAHRALHLRVRVPEWVSPASLRLRLSGRKGRVTVEDGYAVIGDLAADDRGALAFDVACKVERETVDGVTYTTTWVGNQIVDIRPRGTVSPLPF